MHIKTHAVEGPRQHRLFVAVPLFTLCFCLSIGLAMNSVASSAAPTVTEVQTGNITFLRNAVAASGEMTLMESGSTIHLLRGAGLFAARNALSVQVGEFTVSSWHGSIELTPENDSLFVAALTAPAIVRSNTDVWVVPTGMQMHVTRAVLFEEDLTGWLQERVPLPLPAHYLSERLPAAASLEELIIDSTNIGAHILPPLFGQSLRLEQSRTYAEERDAAYRVSVFAASLAAGEGTAAQSFLFDENNINALRSESGRQALPALLSNADALQLTPVLLPVFAEDANMHLIADYHPLVRAHSWVISRSTTDTKALLAALIGLPASDRAPEALPAVAVEQWGEEWEAFLVDNPVADVVLPRLEQDIFALDAAGFPERSRLYAHTVAQAFLSSIDTLSDTARMNLAHLQDFAAGAAPVTSAVEIVEPVVEPVVQAPEDTPLSPEAAHELEIQVRSTLQERGAMFTSQSSFIAQKANRVVVENIVMGTKGGDKLLSFIFEPATGMVVDIEKDGQILPYSLPLDGYLEWVGGN